MKQIRLGIVIFALMLATGIAVSQTRARRGTRPSSKPVATSAAPSTSKRPVTINLKEGDPIQGYFLRADSETVQVEVRSGNMSIRLSEVESMTFSSSNEEPTISISKPRLREADEDETPAPTPKEDVSKANARKAYVALRKLADAARISLPYPAYGALVVETRSLIEQITPTLTDNGLKNDIVATMDAYTDAGQAWGTHLQKDEISVREEPGATLMRKYSIKPGLNRLGNETYLPLDETLKIIWNVAATRLRNVGMLVNQ